MRIAGWMRWRRPVFVHFRAPVEPLAADLPEGLKLDLYDGAAYVSLVALETIGPLPRALLGLGEVGLLRYRQVNLRTYVVGPQGPGILLLDTPTDGWVSLVGARLLGLPYRHVAGLRHDVGEGRVALGGKEVWLRGAIDRPGNGELLQSGTLEYFLLERYWVYGRRVVSYGIRVTHPPWRTRALHLAGTPRIPSRWLAGVEGPILAQVGCDQDVHLLEVVTLAPRRSLRPSRSSPTPDHPARRLLDSFLRTPKGPEEPRRPTI